MSFTYENKRVIYNNDFLEMAEIFCIDEDVEIENVLGIKKKVNSKNDVLVDVEEENFTFTLNFIRKDQFTKQIKPMDRIFLDRATRLFFGKSGSYNTLQLGLYFYYVVPVEGSLKRHDKNNARFSITFQSITPYRYGNMVQSYCVVDTTNTPKDFEITTNGGFNNYTDVRVKCLQNGDLKIINRKNGGAFISVEGCLVGEEFTIDADNIDVIGIDFSRVKGSIKDCLFLMYGSNTFFIETTGRFQLVFEYQEKRSLY